MNSQPPKQTKIMTEEKKHQMLLDTIAQSQKEIDEGKVIKGKHVFNRLLKR